MSRDSFYRTTSQYSYLLIPRRLIIDFNASKYVSPLIIDHYTIRFEDDKFKYLTKQRGCKAYSRKDEGKNIIINYQIVGINDEYMLENLSCPN